MIKTYYFLFLSKNDHKYRHWLSDYAGASREILALSQDEFLPRWNISGHDNKAKNHVEICLNKNSTS